MIHLYNWTMFNEWELKRSFLIDETVLIKLLNQNNQTLKEYATAYYGYQARSSDPVYEQMRAIVQLAGMDHPKYMNVMYIIYKGNNETPAKALNTPSPKI